METGELEHYTETCYYLVTSYRLKELRRKLSLKVNESPVLRIMILLGRNLIGPMMKK
jgi:hypothetical protein